MTIREQAIGIYKAAGYLPRQAITLFSIIVSFPFLLFQVFDAVSTSFKNTTATFAGFTPIQEHTVEQKRNFFFQLKYLYTVEGTDHYAIRDVIGHPTREAAQFALGQYGESPEPISIWYDSNTPDEFELNEPTSNWIVFLSCTVGLGFLAYYLKWLLLKYYELELKD